jgi:pimeloyl-ACP methyl ester carboxylesterase
MARSSDGTSINYETEGHGPALVLLHGGATDATSWRHASYVEAQRTRYGLIMIDARGAGQSDKPIDPTSHTMDAYVADVMAVLSDLRIDDSVCWATPWVAKQPCR